MRTAHTVLDDDTVGVLGLGTYYSSIVCWRRTRLSISEVGSLATTAHIIDITPLAAEKLKDALNEQGQAGALLRVMPMPGPHGGFQYTMSIEENAKEDDFVIDVEGLKVLVDSESAPLVEGAQIDYIDELMRSGFVIKNPNVEMAGGGCACGGGGGGCGGGGGGCGCGGGGCGGH